MDIGYKECMRAIKIANYLGEDIPEDYSYIHNIFQNIDYYNDNGGIFMSYNQTVILYISVGYSTIDIERKFDKYTNFILGYVDYITDVNIKKFSISSITSIKEWHILVDENVFITTIKSQSKWIT